MPITYERMREKIVAGIRNLGTFNNHERGMMTVDYGVAILNGETLNIGETVVMEKAGSSMTFE